MGTVDFNGTTSDIDFGSGTSIDDMTLATNGATYFIWSFPDTIGENSLGRMLGHDAGAFIGFDFGIAATSKLDIYTERPTATGRWRQTNNDMTLDAWNSIGVRYDAALTTNDPSACSNGTIQTVGAGLDEVATPVGAQGSEAASNKQLGNNSAHNVTWDGYMSEFAAWKGYALSDVRLQALARGVNPLFVSETKPSIYLSIWGIESPEPDYSGNNNDGTLTSITQAIKAHPPVEHIENYL